MPINELDACEAIMLEGLDPSNDEAIVMVYGDSPHDLGVVFLSEAGGSGADGGSSQPGDQGAPAVPALPENFHSPGAVDTAEQAWVSYNPPKYLLQWGDTFVGLAKTYLGNGARWREIFNLQPQSARFSKGTTGWIAGQDVINMPEEAARNMQAWLKAGKPAYVTPAEQKKAQGGGGGSGGGLGGGGGLSTGAKLALGGAAAVAAYFLLS